MKTNDANFDRMMGMSSKAPASTKEKEFIPSKYQQAVYDWIRNSQGHAIINACAGSGKTSTLIKAIQHCAETTKGKILFLAFNRSIAATIAERIPRGIDAEAATFNAFGWRICRENVPGVKLDKFKDFGILKKVIDPEKEEARFKKLKNPILRMVGLLKNLNGNTKDWEELAAKYGIELSDLKPMDRFEQALADVYRESINNIRVMSFDDQVFQPIFRGWNVPSYRWVLIDEAQDASPVNIEMAKALAHYGRMILVGDPDQSIYQFRGSAPDAMGTLAKELPAVELPLSICYRCGDKIIESAQKQVPRIEAPVPNPNGEGLVEWIDTEEFRKESQPGDFVLCRTTAPLVKNCLQDIREGKKAFVKGRDVGDGLIELIEKIHGNVKILEEDFYALFKQKVSPSHSPDVPAFIDQVNDYFADQSRRMEAMGREAELIELDAKVETLRVLAEDSDYVVQLIDRIQRIFDDNDDKTALQYMSIHKAKGLENERVYILRLDLIPHPRAKSPEALDQETNMLYVAKTRAKHELYFVRKDKTDR